MGIPENILTKKVGELRKKHLSEREKRGGNNVHTPTAETVVQENVSTTEQPTPSAPQKQDNGSSKQTNIYNLIQLIVRNGEQIVYEEDTICLRAGEYIINELRKDNISVDNPLYQRILDEYLAHCKEPNWIAATYFQYHPDIQISQVAVEMLADKYQLSRMYSRQTVSENVVKEVVPSASDNLPELITRLLLELKLTIVEEKEKIAQEMLTEASKHQDFQLIKTIIEQQQQLLQIKQQLKKLLGRVF